MAEPLNKLWVTSSLTASLARRLASLFVPEAPHISLPAKALAQSS